MSENALLDTVENGDVKVVKLLKKKKVEPSKAVNVAVIAGEKESDTSSELISKEDLDKYYDEYLKSKPSSEWYAIIESLKEEED